MIITMKEPFILEIGGEQFELFIEQVDIMTISPCLKKISLQCREIINFSYPNIPTLIKSDAVISNELLKFTGGKNEKRMAK